MLDDTTPHVAIHLQALRDGKVIDGTLSDENGKYRFVNLKPGQYQVRCYTLNGYVYYSSSTNGKGMEKWKAERMEEWKNGGKQPSNPKVEIGEEVGEILH